MQIVPVEEISHYAVRLLQTPSNSPNSVPDGVTYFDLEVGPLHSNGVDIVFTGSHDRRHKRNILKLGIQEKLLRVISIWSC